jgi:membrane protease YdiL (CAAX protease family)
VRPNSWLRSVAFGLVCGAFLKLAMKAVVMPLLGAPVVNPYYHFLAGNAAAAVPFVLYAVIIGAGFGEETVFRGFLFGRLGKLLGTSRRAKIASVVLTAVLFANAHWNQGLPGVEQAAVMGLVFGGMYAVTGELVVVMVTHAAFDLMAVALIYWSLESRVAHLFFT